MISQHAFKQFSGLMYDVAGISFGDNKKHLVNGRLARRVRDCGLSSFEDYYQHVTKDENIEEFHRMLDLLTTHETYFFREPKHFEYLANQVLSKMGNIQGKMKPIRVWSAASSTGEEAYTLAMVLMEAFGDQVPWEIVATDISRDVLNRAHHGVYRTERLEGIPKSYMRRYFLRGTGSRVGTVRVAPELRQRVQFKEANLKLHLSSLGDFDVAFLRNVLIYFDMKTKQDVVKRVVQQIKKGGRLFIGHSESLNGISTPMRQEVPTIYKKY